MASCWAAAAAIEAPCASACCCISSWTSCSACNQGQWTWILAHWLRTDRAATPGLAAAGIGHLHPSSHQLCTLPRPQQAARCGDLLEQGQHLLEGRELPRSLLLLVVLVLLLEMLQDGRVGEGPCRASLCAAVGRQAGPDSALRVGARALLLLRVAVLLHHGHLLPGTQELWPGHLRTAWVSLFCQPLWLCHLSILCETPVCACTAWGRCMQLPARLWLGLWLGCEASVLLEPQGLDHIPHALVSSASCHQGTHDWCCSRSADHDTLAEGTACRLYLRLPIVVAARQHGQL